MPLLLVSMTAGVGQGVGLKVGLGVGQARQGYSSSRHVCGLDLGQAGLGCSTY